MDEEEPIVGSLTKLTQYGAIGSLLVLAVIALGFMWNEYHAESVKVREATAEISVSDRATFFKDRTALLDTFIAVSERRNDVNRQTVDTMFNLLITMDSEHRITLATLIDNQHKLIIAMTDCIKQ